MKNDTLLCSSLGCHFLLTSFALDPATLRHAAPRCQARRTGWSSVLRMRRARSWRTPGPPRPPRPRTGSRGHQERNDLSGEQNLKKVRKKNKNPKVFSRCFMVFMGVFRCFCRFFWRSWKIQKVKGQHSLGFQMFPAARRAVWPWSLAPSWAIRRWKSGDSWDREPRRGWCWLVNLLGKTMP